MENTEKDESPKITQWSPPCCGVIKLNTDVALSNNVATITVVARDFKGVRPLDFAKSKNYANICVETVTRRFALMP